MNMITTKQTIEIFRINHNCNSPMWQRVDFDDIEERIIKKAMESFAKDRAIAFSKYMGNDAWEWDYREQKCHTMEEHYEYWLQTLPNHSHEPPNQQISK